MNFQDLEFFDRNPKIVVPIMLLVQLLISVYILTNFSGTGDSGDSIGHYLYSRYAPEHIELFFDHWAKPIFVLLSSPFAQFGFTGIKVFNILISLGTTWFTYRTVKGLSFKRPYIAPLFLVFFPLHLVLTFSGLTEPLFAFVLILSLDFVVHKRLFTAAIIVSFLPFVRSEGLIIVSLFGLYFLMNKSYRAIPLLLTGHLVFSVSGYFVHGDLLWVFNKIPYARLSSTYGSGNWDHFLIQLFYVTGVPLYILFWSGFLVSIQKLFSYQTKKYLFSIEFILILLGFLIYFIAHTIFWYLGIFNSMGLKRVMIAIAPLIVILAHEGYNFIIDTFFKFSGKAGKIFGILILIYVIVFPFSGNPAAILKDRDLNPGEDQILADQLAVCIAEENLYNRRVAFNHPYLSIAMDIDFFDKEKRLELSIENITNLATGDLIIWDNWFSVVEMDIGFDLLDQMEDLRRISKCKMVNEDNNYIYIVYEKM